MAKGSAHVIGLEDLQKTIKEFLPRESRNILRRTVTGVAAKARDYIRAEAPVDEGTLKKGIKSRRTRGTKEQVEAEVYAEKDAFYWRFVNDGIVGRDPNPFVDRAIAKLEPELQAIYRNEFGKQLEREMAKRAKKAAR